MLIRRVSISWFEVNKRGLLQSIVSSEVGSAGQALGTVELAIKQSRTSQGSEPETKQIA